MYEIDELKLAYFIHEHNSLVRLLGMLERCGILSSDRRQAIVHARRQLSEDGAILTALLTPPSATLH